ncbi:MAG: hypothetical protein HOW73_23390 [Polyangiaceae bacterium]|nr:hypothetical protein [Polyangiaceae bacterium]
MVLGIHHRFVLGSIAALMGIALATAPGCGDDSEPADEGLPFEQFAESFRQAQCETAVRCGVMPDVETCFDAFAPSRAIAEAVAAVTFGDITYDPQAGETCIDAVKAGNCQGYVLTPAILETCDAVFGNRRGEEEACVADIQCEGFGSICEGACGSDCCPGVCRGVTAQGQEGDYCTPLEPCSEGLKCLNNPETDSPQCYVAAGPNEACVAFQCIDGYSCNPMNARCFKQSSTGEACNPALGEVCASLNDYCDGEQQKCIALPRPGEPCGVNQIAATYCARTSYCAGTTCEALPSVGQPCVGESTCLGQLDCSGDPDFVCGSLPSPSVCVNFE